MTRPPSPRTPSPGSDQGGPRLKAAVDWGDCSPRVEEALERCHSALYRTAECGWIDWFDHATAPAVIEVWRNQDTYLTDDEQDKADLFLDEMCRVGRLRDSPAVPDCLELEWVRTLRDAAKREGLLDAAARDGDAGDGTDGGDG